MSSADDRSSPSAAPSRSESFPRPWIRGSSTSNGEPIFDAAGELVMLVRACSTLEDSESLQKLIVAAVNAFQVLGKEGT